MNIKIYTTTTCPFCRMEKDYLKSKNIEFENIYVDEDDKKAQELIALEDGMFGVPYTIVTKEDGSKETILGFDKAKLNEILGIS